MVLAIILIAMFGVCMGCRFSVRTLIFASTILAIALMLCFGFDMVRIAHSLLWAILLVVALQGGYMLGLAISVMFGRSATN